MLAQVSIFPLDKGESVGKYVAEAVKEIDKSGMDYRMTAMGTIIEGEWDPIMKLLKKMRERLLKHSTRVIMTISIDDRSGDRRRRIESKIRSVEEILGKTLRK